MPTALKSSPRALDVSSAPRYQVLAEALRQQIVGGELRQGEKLPSFRQMRSHYGATQSTVERVLRELERDGLVRREARRGLIVSQRDGVAKKGMIGCMGMGFTAERNMFYWARVLEGIHATASREGRQLLFFDSPEHVAAWEQVDGVLLADEGAEIFAAQLPLGIPIVTMLVPAPGLPCVMADDTQGARLATEHLLQKGHRRIAYLSVADVKLAQLRREGYFSALNAAGIVPHAEWVRTLRWVWGHGHTFQKAARGAMCEWLQNGWHEAGCTAILAHNDEFAQGLIEALESEGIRVPEDVSVVGFDGTEVCELSKPRLSSIGVPLREIGARALEMLLARVEGSDEAASNTPVLLPASLQDRDSVVASKVQT